MKQSIVKEMLKVGDVMIALTDADGAVVGLPKNLAGKSHIVLQLGYDMPIPIPDLRLDADGISATLSFGGQPHTLFVPWAAVYSAWTADGEALVQWTQPFSKPQPLGAVRPEVPQPPPPAPKGNVVSLGDWRTRRGRITPPK